MSRMTFIGVTTCILSCGSGLPEGQGEVDAPAIGASASAATPTTSTPVAPTAAPSDAELPDLLAGVIQGGCDDGPGKVGADSYFIGEIEIAGDQVTGTERWMLNANHHWKAAGGSSCSITWTLVGKVIPAGACADCDLAISVKATPDIAGSDCPEDLVLGKLVGAQRVGGEANAFDVDYDVRRSSCAHFRTLAAGRAARTRRTTWSTMTATSCSATATTLNRPVGDN